MKKAQKEYEYFMRALRICLIGWGSQNRAAIGANISEAYISQILHKKKRASFDAQVAIANAFGFEYIDFLRMGKSPEKATNKIKQKKVTKKKDKKIAKMKIEIGKVIETINKIDLDELKKLRNGVVEDKTD